MGLTSIEWTERTWNPVTGCDKVSPGCAHCYAEGVADRFWAKQYPAVPDEDATNWQRMQETPTRPRRFTDVQTHADRLREPLSWRKPARVFVLDWVIVGGESGHQARPFEIEWARDIIRACKSAAVPVFMKQVGSRPDGWWTNAHGPRFNRHALKHRKGGDMAEWPADLRVREFP